MLNFFKVALGTQKSKAFFFLSLQGRKFPEIFSLLGFFCGSKVKKTEIANIFKIQYVWKVPNSFLNGMNEVYLSPTDSEMTIEIASNFLTTTPLCETCFQV